MRKVERPLPQSLASGTFADRSIVFTPILESTAGIAGQYTPSFGRSLLILYFCFGLGHDGELERGWRNFRARDNQPA